MQTTNQLQEKILVLLTDYQAAAQAEARKEMLDRLNGVAPVRIQPKAYRPKPAAATDLKERLPGMALAFVKKNPKSSILDIAKGLGVEAQALKATMKKMREEGVVKTMGVAKGTRYTAK